MSEAKVAPAQCSVPQSTRWLIRISWGILPLGVIMCQRYRFPGSSSTILWWLPRRCQIWVRWKVPPLTTNCVRGCVALALEPRVLRCNNRKLWRPTGATKSHVHTVSSAIRFRHNFKLVTVIILAGMVRTFRRICIPIQICNF